MVNRVLNPKLEYKKKLEIQELTLKNYEFEQEFDGLWTIENSKGTNRILTDEF